VRDDGDTLIVGKRICGMACGESRVAKDAVLHEQGNAFSATKDRHLIALCSLTKTNVLAGIRSRVGQVLMTQGPRTNNLLQLQRDQITVQLSPGPVVHAYRNVFPGT
jgi:hypothetical protein